MAASGARAATVTPGVKVRVAESDVRAGLAVMSTALWFILLFVTLAFRPDMFKDVAAATSGLIGGIWGYYFAKKS